MATQNEPQVSKMQIDRSIRRILLFEIIFVVTLYALLFFVSTVFLGQQNQVTGQILSRFQMADRVQNIERLMILNSNLVRSYRLNPDEKRFEALVLNHGQFGDLLDNTKDQLEALRADEAANLSEELKLSDRLIKNYLSIVSTSNALLGKSVLSTVAAHRTRNSLSQDFPTVSTDKSPAEIESELIQLEEDSIGIAANWRTLVEKDIDRLTDRLSLSQKLRTVILVLQAILVIVGLIIISYTYVLPSFERILKHVIVQNEELLRADGMKTEFLSIASHQLRTPLSVIKWALSAILKSAPETNLTREQQEMLAQAKHSADSVIGLVGNLLNLSRIEQGRLELHPQKTDVLPIIQQIVHDMQPIAAKKQVQLAEVHPEPTATIEVDPMLFKEVIQNLVDNAIAYNREQGIVKIELKKRDEGWAIDVADTGYGIMPEDLRNLFTKFYRGANARTIRPNGSGIGLYFIRKIVQMHGGRITVDSEPNKGTVFTVYLPNKVKGEVMHAGQATPNFSSATSNAPTESEEVAVAASPVPPTAPPAA